MSRALLLLSLLSLSGFSIAAQPPNVIAIVIDDAGYADFGFMGSQDLATPNIDQMAKQGVVFTDAHVTASVCAPSRAGLMIGRYQQRSGFEANGPDPSKPFGLADEVMTAGDMFKANGYNTYALGKWHLGHEDKHHPNQRGFDEFYGFLAGGRSYFPMDNPSEYRMLQHNGKRVTFEGYLTDVLGDKAIEFIDQNQNAPFFMYLAYNAVHTPMEATEADLALFEGHHRQTLAAMTWSLDRSIGKIREFLKQKGMLDNTLIFFISDNGGAHNNDSTMGPLKGWKGNKYEGGQRVPFVMSWTGGLPQGLRYHGLTSALDIIPTALAAAKVTPKSELGLEGVNLIPHITGEIAAPPHDLLFWRKLNLAAVRYHQYKLVRLDDYGYRLYNLATDIGETKDLRDQLPETFANLKTLLGVWESGLPEPAWGEPQDWVEVTTHIQQALMQNKPADYRSPEERAAKVSGD